MGAKLGGAINLATSTQSSAQVQIFNASANPPAFQLVGSMSQPRESAAAIALPNHLTLVAGGSDCEPATVGGQSGFLCTASNTAELYHQDTQTFSLAGSGSSGQMTTARSGPTVTLITGSGTALDGQVLVVGGSNGQSFLSIVPPTNPPVAAAQNTAELYDPNADSFTAIANVIPTPFTCPQGAASTISAISESGTTVTVTMATANPPGLTVGQQVNVKDVNPAGYDGSFTVVTIPDGAHFTYTAGVSGLAAGVAATNTNMIATSLTRRKYAAWWIRVRRWIPNSGGKVLLAGGDQIAFLGQASTLSFIFDPATQTFTQTTGNMVEPRELFPLIALDTPVTGTLAGKLVAMGGINANSGNCPTTTSPALVTTNSDAEIFDPSTQLWTTVSGPSAVISSASESGNTVTITMSSANPAGLTVGKGVTIAGVAISGTVANFGYNGGFVVQSIPTSNTFTVHNRFSALAAGTGGTATANTMGERRTTTPTFFTTGTLAGEIILPGGVQVEAGTFSTSACAATTQIKQAALLETDLYDPISMSQGTFTASGSLNQAREGQSQGVIGGTGPDAGDLLAAGGACTTTTPSLQSFTIGSSAAATSCNNTGGAGSAENDYSELFSQSTQLWTVGPAPAGGVGCSPGPTCFTPTNAAAAAALLQ